LSCFVKAMVCNISYRNMVMAVAVFFFGTGGRGQNLGCHRHHNRHH